MRHSGSAMLASIIGILALGLSACNKSPEPAPADTAVGVQPGVPVVTAHPQPLAATTSVHATGRLEALDELQLSFKTGGVVESVSVDIGDMVHKGQVLARLDSTEVDAEVKRAEEAFQKAQRDRDRADRLHAQGLVSQEIHDNARMAVDVAEASLQAARFNQAHAAIIAPANGRVLARLVKGREMVAPGVPVLAVSSEGGGWLLKTTLADKHAVKLKMGDAARVTIDAWPDRHFNATVSRVAGMADPQTAAFAVELAIDPQPQSMLRSGMIGRAEITLHNDQQGWTLPVSSLVDVSNDVGKLYVVEADVARERSVKIVALQGERIALTDGVTAEDAVIVAGAAYVNDGQSVSLVTR